MIKIRVGYGCEGKINMGVLTFKTQKILRDLIKGQHITRREFEVALELASTNDTRILSILTISDDETEKFIAIQRLKDIVAEKKKNGLNTPNS